MIDLIELSQPLVMADDDPKAAALVADIMAWSRVADLRADCAELSALYASLSETDRERMLVLLFGSEA